jgi:hypothetical protein
MEEEIKNVATEEVLDAIDDFDYDGIKVVKQYIPIADKREAVGMMVESCVDIQDGLKIVNPISKQLTWDMNLLLLYCGLSADDIGIINMDTIYQKEIMDNIYNQIPLIEFQTLHQLQAESFPAEKILRGHNSALRQGL